MARMRVVSLSRWGEGGIQINFELVEVTEGAATNHTEMAMPSNSSEFNRLMTMKLYDEFNIDAEKAIPAPSTE